VTYEKPSILVLTEEDVKELLGKGGDGIQCLTMWGSCTCMSRWDVSG